LLLTPVFCSREARVSLAISFSLCSGHWSLPIFFAGQIFLRCFGLVFIFLAVRRPSPRRRILSSPLDFFCIGPACAVQKLVQGPSPLGLLLVISLALVCAEPKPCPLILLPPAFVLRSKLHYLVPV
jgi:hypothetical protein